MTTPITIRDCSRAILKRYGIEMEDAQSYPQAFVWSNRKYSLKLYKTYIGDIRLLVMPLHDILADRFYDIKEFEDIYMALDPIRSDIALRQTELWSAYAES